MDAPTNFHQLTDKTKAMQIRIIKAAGENDLRIMLINRYPLKLTEDRKTKSMTELVQEVERVSPNVKIVSRVEGFEGPKGWRLKLKKKSKNIYSVYDGNYRGASSS